MALNDSKSPPLHWAILNNQVDCTKLLAQLPEEQGGGLPMLEVNTLLSVHVSLNPLELTCILVIQ